MALVEIVCTLPDDVEAARRGGADRVELCMALSTGGVTPTPGLLAAARDEGLPFVAMLRPRPGGFAYSPAEWKTMRRDADILRTEGAEGIVVGLLTPDRRLDTSRLKELTAEGPVIFHRAFDGAVDPWADDLDRLIDAGVVRLLTSGRAERAVDGLDVLRGLVDQAAGRIEILPAGGVRAHNALRILQETGADQVHLAPVEPADDGTGAGYGGHELVSEAAVREVVAAVAGYRPRQMDGSGA